jgi:hypothetical protein
VKLQEGCRFEECFPSLELESGNKGFAGSIRYPFSKSTHKETMLYIIKKLLSYLI